MTQTPTQSAATPSSRTILLAHGGGGQLTDELVGRSILPALANEALNELLDSAVLGEVAAGQRPALTIDSYVVQPIEFPGGDIGRLAISGTVNDLAVCGARPVGIALGLILTEGLDRAVLERVMASLSATARQAKVRVVTGDTKVVGRGQADGIFITTAGLGLVDPARQVHPGRVRAGDVVLVSGTLADHGLAVMLAREMPQVQSVLTSDVAPLNGLIESLWEAVRVDEMVFMRDPTRGGLAGLVADLAVRTGLRIVLDEQALPVSPATLHAAEMLGLDVLDVANEGKLALVVRPDAAARALAAMRAHPLGRRAAVIGRVEPSDGPGRCELATAIGGRRIVHKPYGEQLPRIC